MPGNGSRSTFVGRSLLFLTIGVLPFQEIIPTVGGFSVAWILFAAVGLYVGLTEVRLLLKFVIRPAFLWATAFVGAAAVLEWSHDYADYVEIRSIALMFVGAMLIGTLVRDERALRACVNAYIASSVLFASLLVADLYSPLSIERASNVSEASAVRSRVSEAAPFRANLNYIGYTCGLGSILSFLTAIEKRRGRSKYFWYGLAGLTFVGGSLTLSRSGMLITGVLYFLVFLKEKLFLQRRLLLVVGLFAVVLFLTPNVAFKRMGVETAETGTKDEGRVIVLKATLSHLPECLLSGVGVGAFWGRWGILSDFSHGSGVLGTHNVFTQIVMYWGIFALVLLLVTFYQIGKPFLRIQGSQPISSIALVFAIGSLLLMMFMHNLYSKEFSISIGVVTGWGWWLKRRGVAGGRA